jgi:hypothetical protein
MRSISEINQLYGDEFNRRAQRKNACFINSCMKATLLGDISSGGLENGLTVSGVGGQYNFVAMAQELVGGRSVIVVRSTRYSGNKLTSNIILTSNNITIPRHLRDIVVTEYGIADIRGKTDEEVIKAMLNIADSRFQRQLLLDAKTTKKISPDYEIPVQHCNNLPSSIRTFINRYRPHGLFPLFPFGSEFTHDEISLMQTLRWLKTRSLTKKLSITFKGLLALPTNNEEQLLELLGLNNPRTIKERAIRALILGAIRRSRTDFLLSL